MSRPSFGCLALTLTASLTARPAAAFTEDVCFSSGAPASCYDMGDCDAGDASARCTARALRGARQLGDGRSMVHFDATYLIARVVGLDMRTAFLIAAYDQATDLGQYTPVDEQGQPLVDPSACTRGRGDAAACTGTTAQIDGLERTSLGTGGFQLHISMPFNPDGTGLVSSVDGRSPDVEDEDHEVLLANLRAWIYEDAALCVGGMLNFDDGSCEGTSPNPSGTFYGTVPLLGVTEGVPVSLPLGAQAVSTDPAVDSDALLRVVPVSHLDAAKVGIYMHFLQDRISHHVCGDASVQYASPSAPGDVIADYDQRECDAPTHVLRHAWETGYPLDGEHEATRDALEATYDELLAYADYTGSTTATAGLDSVRDAWIDAILANLEIEDGAERWTAMHDQRAEAGYAYPISSYGY